MKRFEIIDGMRGYFLVFMLINHLIFVGGYWMMEVNHRQFAFVEDAQGFVFLSGLLIGMVYARKMIKNGYEKGRQLLFDRAFELYRYAMGTVMAVLVVQLILPDAQRLWYNWLGTTNFDEPLRLAAIATFLFQPTFMDILPQYVVYMLFAPPMIWLCLKGRWAEVMVVSLVLWLAGQLGLQRLVTDPINGWIMGPDKQGIRVSFNLLGWQIVFFSGLVLGVLTSSNRIDWSRVFDPKQTFFPKAAAGLLLFFLPLRILTAHDLLPEPVLAKFAATGEHIAKGKVIFRKAGGSAGQQDYQTYDFEKIYVTGLAISGGQDGEFYETLTLSPTKFKWEYKKQGDKGSLEGNTVVTVDRAKNTAA